MNWGGDWGLGWMWLRKLSPARPRQSPSARRGETNTLQLGHLASPYLHRSLFVGGRHKARTASEALLLWPLARSQAASSRGPVGGGRAVLGWRAARRALASLRTHDKCS